MAHPLRSHLLPNLSSSLNSTFPFANIDALACRLDLCVKAKDIRGGRLLHAFILISQHANNTFLLNYVVQMYGACGSFLEAKEAFCNIHNLNMHSWNIFINVCVKSGNEKEAFTAFSKMQMNGFHPNSYTYICILNACADLMDLDIGRHVNAAIVESGCKDELLIATAIVKVYGQCGAIEDARNVFAAMPERDLIAWSSMIGACTRNKQGSHALELYRQMQRSCIIPDQVACVCVIDACSCLRDLKYGQQVNVFVLEKGYVDDIVISTSLVNMYGKCDSLDRAMLVFANIAHKNMITWNSIITISALNGHRDVAANYFRQMQLEGLCPDHSTYIAFLNACNCRAAFDDGRRLHSCIQASGILVDIVLETALIGMYGRCEALDEAKQLFAKMRNHDTISSCTIITACTQNSHDEEALIYFSQMHLAGIDADAAVFVSVLDACGSLAALEKGHVLHAAIVEVKLERDITVGTALINMYGKCGNLYNAETVFRHLQCQNMVTWSAMIAAYAHNGDEKEAIDLFQQMQDRCVVPNDVTFRSVLTACSHTGQIVEGVHTFLSFAGQVDGSLHMEEHSLSVMDLLGRAGHLDAAEDMIENVPREKKAIAWSCLLGACKIHEDSERGARIASHLFQLDPDNAAVYISLSNLYATGGG